MLSLLLACSPIVPPALPVPEPTLTCVSTWRRTSGASLLAEQRASGVAPWPDFPTMLRAAAIDATMVPVAHTERFHAGGTPIVYFTADRQAAVVDQLVFTDLAVVDATALAAGQVARVGAVKPAFRLGLGDADLVALLIEADVVRIYAHVEGEVCVSRVTDVDGSYTAHLDGEHTYFTNAENHARLAFDVTIAKDGEIVVVGR